MKMYFIKDQNNNALPEIPSPVADYVADAILQVNPLWTKTEIPDGWVQPDPDPIVVNLDTEGTAHG